MFLAQETRENVNIGNAKFVFIQPNADCGSQRERVTDNPWTNVRYFNYSPSDWYYLCLRNREVRSNHARPVFMTDSGYESCSCSREITHAKEKCKNGTKDDSYLRQRKTGRMMEHSQFEFIIEDDEESLEDDTLPISTPDKVQLTRSASCNTGRTSTVKSQRRVSVLVDELLLKIYGGRTERRCSGGTDVHTFEGSTDSSNSFKSNSSLLKKKRSFSGIPEDKCRRWNNMVRTRLMHKSLMELRSLKATLEYNVSHAGSQLIRQLKRRDFLHSRRDAQCSVITAFLQATSAKRSRGNRNPREWVPTRRQFLGRRRPARLYVKRKNAPFRTKSKAGVHWSLALPDRIPIETTIVQVEEEGEEESPNRETASEADQRRISQEYVEFGQKKKVKKLRQQLPDSESNSSQDDSPAQLGPRKTEVPHSEGQSPGHEVSVNSLRAVKVRLNSAYRAKINELGVTFKFALSAEEKMRMRRNRFFTNKDPVIPVSTTLASDLKEKLHSYCGRRKQPASWLYNIVEDKKLSQRKR